MKMKRVYFMKPIGRDGPIKIGCSGWPNERLLQIAIWSPDPLEVIYSEEGSFKLERNLHRCFADYHRHSEWFEAGPRLVEALARLKAGEKIADVVDLSKHFRSVRCFSGKKPMRDGMEGFKSYLLKLVWARKRVGHGGHDASSEIMDRWKGKWEDGRMIGQQRPTDEEFKILDDVLASYAKSPVMKPFRYPRAKKVAAQLDGGRLQ